MINRILDYWDSFGLPKFLISVNIEPTNHCQLNCGTCYRDHSRSRGYMTWATFEEIAKQIYNIPTISSISLNGAGESTLHPRFFDMVDYFSDKKNKIGRKYKIGFSTNGNNSVIDALDKVDIINFSLDGIGRTHELYRKGSNWDKVNRNILELTKLKRNRTKICANLVKSTQSDFDIDEFNEYCDAIGFDSYNITNYHDKDLKIIDNGLQLNQNYKKCRLLNHTAMVLWNGDVTTCCSDLNGINICGNILKKELGIIKRTPGNLCKECNYWKLDEVKRQFKR